MRMKSHPILAKKVISSGVVEGLNNKAKVTMRKSYGFRTFRVTELPCIMCLASSPSLNSPTDSTDESEEELSERGEYTLS